MGTQITQILQMNADFKRSVQIQKIRVICVPNQIQDGRNQESGLCQLRIKN